MRLCESDDCDKEKGGSYKLSKKDDLEGGGGCSVNWRNVWAGAVVGLVTGATTGAYTEPTAGTVTFPVVGAVTGGVSGGVVGGAIGFVTGGVSATAAELLTT
ncbi:hypothetical protein [Echinicola vietnamensis]|uniref:Glycine zipper domain-containing protein n=1 Tax=Echinicola vietnamensis (strain DSM 17526 / LMG 23754 / KMM 6221) TaxID=926556 RepID=L0G4E5_ECHVK|nr:hypothetical protein [Echinicola vietnamensis]AGA80183.1 hypothetical protein Echvi_3976 [Echinicola vietnamensis DSM 17526]